MCVFEDFASQGLILSQKKSYWVNQNFLQRFHLCFVSWQLKYHVKKVPNGVKIEHLDHIF